MKKQLIALTVVAAMTGCASNNYATQYEPTVKPQKVVKVDIPKWYIQPPKMTEQSIFVAGTAVSTDLMMSTQKAMLDADSKLAFQMESQIKAMVKSYKNDQGESVIENSEVMAKKVAAVTINGHHQSDMVVTQEGNKFRVFILMRYPIGAANHFATLVRQQADAKNAALREKEMARELDQTTSTVTPIRQGMQDNTNFEVLPSSQVNTGELPHNSIADEQLKKEIEQILKDPKAVVISGTLR